MRGSLFVAIALAILSACALTNNETNPASASGGNLVGVWRCIKYETWDSAGQRQTPFGDPPSGYAVFSKEGLAFIQLTGTMPTSGAIKTDPSKFAAYYGPYTVDPSGSFFAVEVEGTNLPSAASTVQRRPFRISGDTLVLGIPGEYEATLIRVPLKP